MDILDLLQWPAMAASVVAGWLVASRSAAKRSAGFWCFLASNLLWVAWGLHDSAYALVALQFFLGATNVRGVYKND
jgi:hypothetical protein